MITNRVFNTKITGEMQDEMYEMSVKGIHNKHIAEKLNVSVTTVRFHLENMGIDITRNNLR